VFRDETPKAARTGAERMGELLESLSDNMSNASLVRQVFRISREYPGEAHPVFWNEWFSKLLNLSISVIENCPVF
jgi:hypothetical protein